MFAVNDSVLKVSFSYDNYNELLSVEDAYSRVIETNNLQNFLREICDLALKYGLSDTVCIRLAHKHWLVKSDQIRLENSAIRLDKQVLLRKLHAETLSQLLLPRYVGFMLMANMKIQNTQQMKRYLKLINF